MSRITRALLALTLLALAAPASAAAAPTLVPVGTFSQPVHAASPPGDPSRLYVVEQPGVVRTVRDGVTLATPFLDISADVLAGGERGLLSIAFPPDYSASGLFYVYYTAQPAGDIQVREFRRSATDPDRADPAGRLVWSQAHPNTNHNGGQVHVDDGGLLWFATGDGGGQGDPDNNAQNPASQLGKVLRIGPRPGNAGSYTIPAGNPYGTAVWAIGLRNPFRFSFDRDTGDLVIGDVGGGVREEINWAPASEGRGAGANYGWSCREGTISGPRACDPGSAYVPPVFDYEQASPRAITGGYVVRDPGLPTLLGRYLYADTYVGQVRSLVLARPRATDDRGEAGLQRGSLVSFAEDACGRLYVVSLNGTVDRIQDGAPGPCRLKLPPAPPGPPGPPRPTVPDRTSPRVRIEVARKGRVGRRATPRIRLTATETCRVTIRARIAGTTMKRVRTPLRGGRRTIVRLRPKAKAVKRIYRALRRHRRVTLVVSVTAVDAAGNVGRVQRRLKVRRG